jgi:hypothetical protein
MRLEREGEGASKNRYGDRVRELRAEIDKNLKDLSRSPEQYYCECFSFFTSSEIFGNEMAYIRMEFEAFAKDAARGIYTTEEIKQIEQMEADFVKRARLWDKFRRRENKNFFSKERFSQEEANGFSQEEAERLLELELSYDDEDSRAVKCLESYLEALVQAEQGESGLKKCEQNIARLKEERDRKARDRADNRAGKPREILSLREREVR